MGDLVLFNVDVAGGVVLGFLLPVPLLRRLKHVGPLVRVHVVLLVVVEAAAHHVAPHELLHDYGRLRLLWHLGWLVLARHDQQQFIDEQSETLGKLFLAHMLNLPLLELPGHADHALDPVLVGLLGVLSLQVHVCERF